jgi:hypothetical protein
MLATLRRRTVRFFSKLSKDSIIKSDYDELVGMIVKQYVDFVSFRIIKKIKTAIPFVCNKYSTALKSSTREIGCSISEPDRISFGQIWRWIWLKIKIALIKSSPTMSLSLLAHVPTIPMLREIFLNNKLGPTLLSS